MTTTSAVLPHSHHLLFDRATMPRDNVYALHLAVELVGMSDLGQVGRHYTSCFA